jgi:hypothetical protein
LVEVGSEGAMLVRVVEFPDLDDALIEIVEQAGIDAHLAEVLTEGLPVGSAAADGAVVDANHPIAPDIGRRLTRNAHLIWWEIRDPPREPATEGAVAVRNPRRRTCQLYAYVAAMTASEGGHGNL